MTMKLLPRLTVSEYVAAMTEGIRALVDWRERYDAAAPRSPEVEAQFREEWNRLANQAQRLIAQPVEGVDRG